MSARCSPWDGSLEAERNSDSECEVEMLFGRFSGWVITVGVVVALGLAVWRFKDPGMPDPDVASGVGVDTEVGRVSQEPLSEAGIPWIDERVPAQTEMATFALG